MATTGQHGTGTGAILAHVDALVAARRGEWESQLRRSAGEVSDRAARPTTLEQPPPTDALCSISTRIQPTCSLARLPACVPLAIRSLLMRTTQHGECGLAVCFQRVPVHQTSAVLDVVNTSTPS
jgi:hypothetical protein